jgi:hypothetical protein
LLNHDSEILYEFEPPFCVPGVVLIVISGNQY